MKSEAAEQKEIVAYFRKQWPQFAMSLRVSQSGGFRGKGRQGAIRTANYKALGAVTGEADIAIMLPRGGYAALLIEHKAAGGYSPTVAQLQYIKYHNEIGNCAIVTRGVEAATTAIKNYMEMPVHNTNRLIDWIAYLWAEQGTDVADLVEIVGTEIWPPANNVAE